jgi:serine/threonine protein kinase
MLAPNVVLQGRYRIIRQLGEGGMGAVYEAINEPVCSIVALKETFAQTEEEQKAFVREAKLLANLDHEAFPKVIDHFFEHDGQYLVMEFVRGNDFSELLSLRERPFEPQKVLEWADQLLDALEELHSYPIIHRDIKPSNLKLTRRGKIKLLDFGIAKGSLESMTKPKTDGSLGAFTLQYAPIEQTLRASPHWVNVLNIINAEKTDKILAMSTNAQSDIYSLGATLYHLLTSQTPVDAPTRAVAVWSGKLDPLLSADKLNTAVSPALAAVLSHTIALDRDDRPNSAVELRSILRNFISPKSEITFPIKDEAALVIPSVEVNTRLAFKSLESNFLEQPISSIKPQTVDEIIKSAKEVSQKIDEITLFNKADDTVSGGEPDVISIELLTNDEEDGVNLQKINVLSVKPLVPMTESAILPPVEKQMFSLPSNKNKNYLRRKVAAAVLILGLAAGFTIWQGTSGGERKISASVNNNAPAESMLSLAETANPKQANFSTEPLENRRSTTPIFPKMARIPAGTFVMGSNEGDIAVRPAHKAVTNSFLMDVYEVTNEEYAAFVRNFKVQVPSTWNQHTKTFPKGKDKHPVTGVNWGEANEYCQKTGKRLPTEEEWEFAARGTDRRIYPWGDVWEKGMANANHTNQGLIEVGKTRGVSPFGIYDLIGNAWEWTASEMKAYAGGKMPTHQPAGKLRVIRGGTYQSSPKYANAAYRTGWPETGANTYNQTGFRCVRDIEN